MTAVTFLIQIAMYVDGGTFVDFAMQGVGEQFAISGNILNGYLVTYLVLQSLLIHIPLLVALVAGDVLAGEANMGTRAHLSALNISCLVTGSSVLVQDDIRTNAESISKQYFISLNTINP